MDELVTAADDFSLQFYVQTLTRLLGRSRSKSACQTFIG
jgi:hypothetical protein